MGDYGYGADDRLGELNTYRLWAGGLATAVVAGLIILVGVLVVRGVFTIPVLAPEEAGFFGDASTGFYAAIAALAAIAATALLHLLLLTAPRPLRFFGWIAGLATAVAVVSPFTRGAELDSQISTALINLVAGIAIISLLTGVGGSALARRVPRPPGYASGRRDAGPPTRPLGTSPHVADPDAETRRMFRD